MFGFIVLPELEVSVESFIFSPEQAVKANSAMNKAEVERIVFPSNNDSLIR